MLRSLSVEVGKGNMTQEEAEQAFAFYQQQAAKGAQDGGKGTPTPAPQKGGAEGQDELAALIAERERRAAAKGGQRNIPGMPKRQQEQPAPEPTQTQQQPAPNGEEAAAEPAQGKDRAAAIAQLAKDTGLDEGHAERAYNVALNQYKASQRRGGNRSFESFLNAQATWMMTHGRQGRRGRR